MFWIDFRFILVSQPTSFLTVIVAVTKHCIVIIIQPRCIFGATVEENSEEPFENAYSFFLLATQLAQYQTPCLPERTSPHTSCSGLVSRSNQSCS